MGQPFVQEKICPVSNTVHISYSDIGYSDSFRLVSTSLDLKLLDIVTNIGYSDYGFD